jgi:hypothetical protein
MYQLFKEVSAVIFDTNLYGSAFIQFTTKSDHAPSSPTKVSPEFIDSNPKSKLSQPFHTSIRCNNKNFYYIRTDSSFVHSQHAWAIMKLIYQIDTHQDNTLKHSLNLDNIFANNLYYQTAKRMYNFLKKYKYTIPYHIIVNELGKYTSKSSDLYTSFVSLVNFFGHETYFTRGSFLDVVVNTQMCKIPKVPLDSHAYLDSFIENTADFIHSWKEKYLKRAQLALEKLRIPKVSKSFQEIVAECKGTPCKLYTTLKLLQLIVTVLDTLGPPKELESIPVFFKIIDVIKSLRTITLAIPSGKPIVRSLRTIDETKSLENTPRASIV